MDDLIQLQNANMLQLTNNGVKADWVIRENKTDEVLATMSNRISDQDMFAIIHFAREFELKAFNAGINFAKKQNMTAANTPFPQGLQLTQVG